MKAGVNRIESSVIAPPLSLKWRVKGGGAGGGAEGGAEGGAGGLGGAEQEIWALGRR